MLWRAALAESRRCGETVVFVIPDVLYPRGTLTRWVELLEAGAAAVFGPALQVVCETALPELEQRFPDPAGPFDLDAAAAGSLGLRHLHPLWIAHVRGSPRASFHPGTLMRAVDGGVNIRLLALYPFCVDPRRAGLHAGIGTVPGVPIAWDPVTVLSLEPACKQLDRSFRGTPLDRDAMTGSGGWFDDVSALEHPAIGVDFAVPARASDDRALRASSHAASFFVTQARLGRRIHRVWRAMHRLGCHDAARVLATAHFVLPLRRRWRHRGAVTLLVPRATLRDPMTRAAVHDGLTAGHEPALAALIDAHVVLGDVTLRHGASYAHVESAPDRPGLLASGSRRRRARRSKRPPVPRIASPSACCAGWSRTGSPSTPSTGSCRHRARARRASASAAPSEAEHGAADSAPDGDIGRARSVARTAAAPRGGCASGSGWRRLGTITRWIYHHVLVSRPPLAPPRRPHDALGGWGRSNAVDWTRRSRSWDWALLENWRRSTRRWACTGRARRR